MFNIIDDASMFQPESMMSSSLFDDPLFLIAVIACCGFAAMAWFFGEQPKSKNEEIDSIENNTADVVSDAVNEAINNPTPEVQDTAIVQNTQQVQSDENGTIKRVIKTETVIEYCNEQTSVPREISVRCPACGTINKVLEGSSTQCTSCLYTIQAVMR